MKFPDRIEAKYFGAAAKSAEEVLSSTSGGVASVMSRCVTANGGVVFGAAFDPFPIVKHISVEDATGIERLKGSKYVESDIRNALKEAVSFLRFGRKVLFIGLPCQVAALYGVLGGDDDNLITVDLICHGTPPQKLFTTWVKELEIRLNAKIVQYIFRNKRDCGWNDKKTFVHYCELEDGRYVAINGRRNWYSRYFLGGSSFKEGCYRCPFAKIPRVADVSIGDFWGGGEDMRLAPYVKSGLSLVSVQSEKGLVLCDLCSQEMEFISVSADFAIAKNPQLLRPSQRPVYRSLIFHYIYMPQPIRHFCDRILFGFGNIAGRIARSIKGAVR